MYILGLNAYHGDAAACIFHNGNLIAASEEERFRRIKHWAGFPSLAVAFCLKEANINVQDLDIVAISRNPSANLYKKIGFALSNINQLSTFKNRLANSRKVKNIRQELAEALQVPENEIKAQIKNVEHHRSHLASAFFASPFQEAALLSIDGFGDFTSTMTATGSGNNISVLDSVYYPHSCGIFYTAFTQFLGFAHYGDEYKVMGLAPYGKPLFLEKLRQVVILKDKGLFELDLKYFKHAKEGVSMAWEGGAPHIEPLFSEFLSETFGKPHQKEEALTDFHFNLAASVQAMCEEIIFNALRYLHQKTGLDSVCVAGGVAQNSVANGKISKQTPFKNIYIPSAGHDAGTAVGAALYVYNQELQQPRIQSLTHAYTGSRFSNQEIIDILEKYPEKVNYVCLDDDALFEQVSECLANGGVVGWFQGRAEFGARALGNRSILADPRRADAKQLLNEKIKKRESFRPFAPSILADFAQEYFEIPDGEQVPFMEKVFPIKTDKQHLIPAVTHVDGTGRLQTVREADNPKYYRLIYRFYQKTNIPILLNTSFNENEPIVNNPQEAIACFLRTRMDMLILENILIDRKM